VRQAAEDLLPHMTETIPKILSTKPIRRHEHSEPPALGRSTRRPHTKGDTMKKKLVLLVAAAAASVLPMTASASAAPAAGDPTKTIAEQASADPQFSTLVAALGAADLVGPFDACDRCRRPPCSHPPTTRSPPP
jgi:hypothetical protein